MGEADPPTRSREDFDDVKNLKTLRSDIPDASPRRRGCALELPGLTSVMTASFASVAQGSAGIVPDELVD